jgi:DNA-binding NtrC family response regulator
VLVAALACLQAEALAGGGRHSEAAQALFDADLAVDIHSRMGAYYRAAGVVLRRAGYPSGQTMFARAKAIWDEQQNRYELIEAQPAFKVSLGVDHAARALGKSPSVVNALAAVFSLSRSPRLVARELVNIIETLGCGDDVTVADGPLATGPPEPVQSTRTLSLGDHRGNPVHLVCRVPGDPQQALLLSDIFRITQAALELERHREAERNRAALWTDSPAEERTGALFVSEEMQAILGLARRIAATNVPVLITGETGTGKEVLARVIHAHSQRAKGLFVPFNCTSTPKDMLDSQLFGHRRGSFTGAVESFPGIIRGAAGGTLFLDEIGDMGLELQPKLLRFLDSHEVHPIGETQPVVADVRVIAATNVDLDTLVTQGHFREDLFYRLNIVRLPLPPLRERRVEIPALVDHYLQKFAREYSKGDLRLSEETMEYLILYRWPGNVRQLANEMRRMAVMAETGAVLMPEHLTADILGSRRTLPPSERALLPTEVVVRLDQPMAAGVEHVERCMMLYALKKCGGRIEETAKMLGLSRKGLYLKRQRFGIDTGEDIEAAGAA